MSLIWAFDRQSLSDSAHETGADARWSSPVEDGPSPFTADHRKH